MFLYFAVTPRSPPIGEYIAAVERACQNIEQGEAEELRAEVKAVMKKSQTPGHNITREEQKDLKELKEDNTRVVLTADKGVCMVMQDREEYIEKAEELLNQDSYKIIPADPGCFLFLYMFCVLWLCFTVVFTVSTTLDSLVSLVASGNGFCTLFASTFLLSIALAHLRLC